MSWEHLSFFLSNNIKESDDINLSTLWNISEKISETVTVKDKNKNLNFHEKGNKLICNHLCIEYNNLMNNFSNQKKIIINNGELGIEYWESCIKKIRAYDKEKAINELIQALKLREKILTITKFINSLKDSG